MLTAPELLRRIVYKQRNCDHKILMPCGFEKWEFVDCIEVFSRCPHCNKCLTPPKK